MILKSELFISWTNIYSSKQTVPIEGIWDKVTCDAELSGQKMYQ